MRKRISLGPGAQFSKTVETRSAKAANTNFPARFHKDKTVRRADRILSIPSLLCGGVSKSAYQIILI